MKKISWLMVLVFAFTFLTPNIIKPAADFEPVKYWLSDTTNSIDSMITKEMWENTKFKNQYLKTNGGSNLVNHFFLEGSRNIKSNHNFNKYQRLYFGDTYEHWENKKDIWYGDYRFKLSPFTKDAIANGGVELYLEAQLNPDNHMHIINHKDKLNDRAAIKAYGFDFNGNRRDIGEIINNSNDPNRVFTLHKRNFDISPYASLKLQLQSTTCGCGSSKIRDTVVALVDNKAPEVKNAFIGNLLGTKVNYLTSGTTAYAILEFTEPIRFANHSNPLAFDIYLDLYDTLGQSSLDDKLTATLYDVRNNRLWFKFTVPDKLSDNKNINAYISGISASQPNLIHNEGDFILSALADEKKITNEYGNVKSNLTAFKSFILDGNAEFNVNRARSPITDLAGNSVNWKGVIPISRTYLDGVAPKLEDLELALTDNAVATYAGVGSKIELSAFFSEEMKFTNGDVSDIKATLNISKSGTPVTVKGSKLQTVSIGTNRPPVSKLIFESLEIDGDMSCTGTEGRVAVTGIAIPDGFRDKSGNKVEEGAIPLAKQQVNLDVTAPNVTYSSMGQVSGVDLAYQITINDPGSGVLGAKGQFAWIDKSSDSLLGTSYEINNTGKTFLYAITDNGTIPSEFKQGTISDSNDFSYISFNQLSGINYLYIKLPNDSDAIILDSEIRLILSDRTNNYSEEIIDLKGFKTDNEVPAIDFGEHYFTQEDEEMQINVPVFINDVGGIAEVYYTWGAGEADTAISGFNITTAFSGIISNTVTAGVYDSSSTISIKAVDLSGNENIKGKTFNYDTTVATSNLGAIQRNPKDMSIIGPSLYIDRPIVGGAWDGATTVIMVKDPFGNGNKYFVNALSDKGDSLKEGGEYQDFFEKYRNLDFWNSFSLNDWYSANAETVTESVYGEGYKLSNITALGNSINTSSNSPSTDTEKFAAMFGQVNLDKPNWHYYGNIDMEVVTVIGNISMTGIAELTNYPSKASFTMRSADPAKFSYLYETKVGDIEKHDIQDGTFETNWFRPDIYGLPADSGLNKNKEPGKTPVTLSLEVAEGLQIPFKISKNNNALLFDYDDIDESKSYISLYYTGHEVSVLGSDFPSTAAYYKPNAGQQPFGNGVIEEIVKAPIYATGNTQYLTISINSGNRDKYKTGYYAIVTNIVTKSKDAQGKSKVKEELLLSDLFIDSYVPEELTVDYLAGRYHFLDSMTPDITHIADKGQSLMAPVGEDTSWNVSVGYSPENERKGQLYYSNITDSTLGGRGNADIDMTDMLWVKMWNTDVANSEANALWQHVSRDYMLKFVDKNSELQEADYYKEAEGKRIAYVPVIYGEKNTILYQICSYNGVPSGTKQFTLISAEKNDRPVFDLTLNPDTPDKIVNGIIATPRNVQSKVPLLKFGAYTDAGDIPNLIYSKILDDYGYLQDDLNSIPYLPIDSNKIYTYYILDEYGMAGTKSVTIDNVDSELKSINVDADTSTPDNIVKFTAVIEDDYSLDEGYLTLEFWGRYVENLSGYFGAEIYKDPQGYDDDRQFINLPIPLVKNKLDMTKLNKAGIYSVKITDGNDSKKKTVDVEMVLGQVPAPAGNGYYDNNIIMVGAIDWLGNGKSHGNINFDTQDYKEPSFVSAEWKAEKSMLYLDFDTPVRLMSHNIGTPDYSTSLPANIGGNGTYIIKYADVFGKEYEKEININVEALKLSLETIFSTTAPTNQPIDLTVQTFDNGVYITKVQIDGGEEENLPTSTSKYTKTIEENCIVYVTVSNLAKTRVQAIPIENIDKILNTPAVHWVFEGNVEGNSTDGPVIVSIAGDEPLEGDLTHIFSYGAKIGDKHKFEYVDMAGNTGELTVTLQYNIVKPINVVDNSAPGVNISIYKKTFGAYKEIMSGSAGNFNIYERPGEENQTNDNKTAKGENLDWSDGKYRAQAFRLDFGITDASKTKIFIKETNVAPSYSGRSDVIDKATIKGNSIFLETDANTNAEPGQFYIFVVDENNNWTSFKAIPGSLDMTVPEATVSYKQDSLYEVKATLKIDAEDADDTTVTNKTGIIKNDDGTYTYTITKNETFIFYFHDGVGNSGEKSVKVDTLDVYPPEVIKLEWSSSLDKPIRENPVAHLTMKNPISEAKIVEDSNHVKLSFTDKKIDLIYSKNASITLKITSRNGKFIEYLMPEVSCIDKEAPTIGMTKTVAANKRSAPLTFTTNEDTYFIEGKQWFGINDTIKYTATSDKPFKLHFTDKAGNTVEKDVDLSGSLDFTPLKIEFSKDLDGSNPKSKLSDLEFAWDGETKFYVKSSHNAKVTGSVSDTVTSDLWKGLTINTQEDKISLKFTDDRGDSFSTVDYKRLPDTTPPAIILKNAIVSLIENSTQEQLKSLLKASCTVWDNKSTGTGIIVTLDTDGVDLTVKGYYIATITAEDEAGNSSSRTIQVRVAVEEDILVKLGDRIMEPGASIMLYDDKLPIELLKQDKNPADEPYNVYIMEGLQTPGQMKSDGIKCENDKEIKFTETGLHTVYIRTQNRYAFLLYVYVMD